MKAHNEFKKDITFAIVTIVFSLFYAASTCWTIAAREETFLNGRTFPYFIAVILFILGACLLYTTCKQLKRDKQSLPPALHLSLGEMKRVALYLVILSLYCFGIVYVGYVVSTALTLLVLMIFNGAKNKIAIALMTAIVPCCMWYIFSVLMEVQFPQALLY